MKVSPSVLARLQAITALRQINDSQFAAMCGVGADGQRRSRNWGNKLLRRGAGLWPVTSRHAFAEQQGLPLDYFDEHVTYPVPTSAIEIPSRAGLRRFGGAPFVLGQQGGGAPRSTNDPLPTVTTDGAISCVEPFLLPNQGNVVRSIDRPMPTITAEGGRSIGLVEPFVVQITHGGREHELGKPLPTITGGSRGDLALVEPFTMPYYSNGGQLARPVSQPVGTITTRDRFALVISDGVDIRFRMLQPHELAAAMGFPAGYQFLGTKTETIRMIGNAWSCRVAQALCACLLRDHARVGRTRREEAIA